MRTIKTHSAILRYCVSPPGFKTARRCQGRKIDPLGLAAFNTSHYVKYISVVNPKIRASEFRIIFFHGPSYHQVHPYPHPYYAPDLCICWISACSDCSGIGYNII